MGRSDHNNFDCIRLFAAILVLVSHSFPLTGVPNDPFSEWLGYDSGGTIGVAIFFVISGYLVSASVERRSTTDYLIARVLRIIPALVLVSCFTAFVIGPVFTKLPLSTYFADATTWKHLANPQIFGITYGLPGVFETLPYTAVNGSLWTLPMECSLYLLLPAAAFCGVLTRRGAVAAFVVCASAYFTATGYFGLSWSNQGPEVIKGVLAFSALKLATFFFAGAALWALRDVISLHAGGAVLCCALLFAAARTATATAAYVVCLPYLVLFVALKLPAVSLRKVGDLSYGTYLFAFPVQQSLVATFGVGQIGPYRLSLYAIPIVLMLAVLSWHFVESRALRMRRPAERSMPMAPAVSIMDATARRDSFAA